MSSKELLKNNLFADCNVEELKILWEGLKDFYCKGFTDERNPFTLYKNEYIKLHSSVGVVLAEQDLLRAIACKCFDEE